MAATNRSLKLNIMDNKDTYINAEMQRGKAKAENRDSFIASNYWLWVMVAFVAYPLASILSACTEGGHVFMRVHMTGAPFILSLIFTLLIAGLIEMLSYFLGKGAVDDIQGGVFSKSTPHKAAFFIKLIGFLAIMGFSVFLSMSGAPLLNEQLRKSYTPPTADFISIDSIANYYDAKVALIRMDIEAAKKTTWKGSITSSAMKSIRRSQDQIEKIEEASQAAILAANTTNAGVQSDWMDETETNSSFAIGFAGLGEIIKLFCLLFIGIYDQGLSNEAAVFGGGGSSKQKPYGNNQSPIGFATNQADQNMEQSNLAPTPRNPIGFKIPDTRASTEDITSSMTDDRWPHVATTPESNWDDNEPEILAMALKHAQSSQKKWSNKLKISHGADVTNKKHIDKWSKYADLISKKLNNTT